MAEESLGAASVEAYTKGRLGKDDSETKRLLAAALTAARGWCGWHVTPIRTTTVTVDGPGGHVLALPTLALGTLSELTEDGVAVDLSTVHVSPLGLVRKHRGCRWSRHYGAITATMVHGFECAPDFDAAVLALVDRMSSVVGEGVGLGATKTEKRVGENIDRWQESEAIPLLDEMLLGPYRLLALA